jgi:tRNA threonylcarbamoyladenosine biosynthesis protein TsaE
LALPLAKAMHFTLENIDIAAEYALTKMSAQSIAVYGEMGAGKTTFTKSLCNILQVTSVVSSPTFSIVNEYLGVWKSKQITVAHMDWYRLADAKSLFDAGIPDYFEREDVICIVEWPERAPELLLPGTLKISLDVIDEHERVLHFDTP